jgi:hypothetical protein
MPYIKNEYRSLINGYIKDLTNVIRAQIPCGTDNAGVLNYTITKLLLGVYQPDQYWKFNEIMGILECVKQELYRRSIVPYEDKKILENGDIF